MIIPTSACPKFMCIDRQQRYDKANAQGCKKNGQKKGGEYFYIYGHLAKLKFCGKVADM